MSKTIFTRGIAGGTAILFPFMSAAAFGIAQKDRSTDFEYGVETGMMLVGGLGGFLLILLACIVNAALAAMWKPFVATIIVLVCGLLAPLALGEPWTLGKAFIVLTSTLIMFFLLLTALGGPKQKNVKVETKDTNTRKSDSSVDPAVAAFGKKIS